MFKLEDGRLRIGMDFAGIAGFVFWPSKMIGQAGKECRGVQPRLSRARHGETFFPAEIFLPRLFRALYLRFFCCDRGSVWEAGPKAFRELLISLEPEKH